MKVLDSLAKFAEYRFDYTKLYNNSEFRSVLDILDKIYDPHEKISENDRALLRTLNVRDGVSVFVFDKKNGELYLYDVLRINRDYGYGSKTKAYDSVEETVSGLDDASKQKFEYYANFNFPILVEVEDISQPNTGRLLYTKYEEDGTFHNAIPAVKLAFKPLMKQNLFKRVIDRREIEEEGCLKVRDYSDQDKVWIWGYSSKLV